MKILCLANDAFGGHGGIGQACCDVISAMADLGSVERIDVLTRRGKASPAELPAIVHQRPALESRTSFIAAALQCVRHKPDVVFCSHLYLSPLAATVASLSDARLVIHLHGIEIWSRPTYLQRRAMESADALWCVSRDTRARALTFADVAPERAIVLSNSVRREFTPGDKAAARERLELDDAFVLLTVGRLDSRERYKGHDRVLAALPQLQASGKNVLYLIAGEGDDHARLSRLARYYKVDDAVRFLGGVSADDLPDLYRAADLFVLPSTGEGFGIAFLEAMACGTPAIGLAAGGAPDALADGELGVCTTEAQFADALNAALANPPPDREGLSAEVRRRFGRERLAADVARALARLGKAEQAWAA